MYQALRITPYPNNDATIKELQDVLPQILGDQYVFGVEFAKNHHIHAVFRVKEDFDKNLFKDDLYSMLAGAITNYDNTKSGNTVFSIKPVVCLDKAVQYAVKDGKSFYSGDTQWTQYIENEKKNAFEKPQSIRELMENLYSRFENDEINERTLWIEMVHQRAQFPDQKTRYSDIDAFVETFNIRKHGIEYVKEIWEQRNIKL